MLIDKINTCMGNLYCRIEAMKCLGKETNKEELLMKKLHVAKWLACDCNNCGPIECFINQVCHC